jgi:tRNA pseudouridine55 synthase
MDELINIYKPIGMTPLQLIKKLRKTNIKYRDLKIGYAGRLDPLAHGVMLLMVGGENKNREKSLGLNKIYEFSVWFGVKTDTYDYLGFLKDFKVLPAPIKLEDRIRKFIKSHTEAFRLTYPPFSSKTIGGIQLYKLAKSGRLKNNELPARMVQVNKFKLISIKKLSSEKIKEVILKNVQLIRGFFRQKNTIKKWEAFFDLYPSYKFTIASFSIECSSGTYVRSIANDMGEDFGCNAIAYEILRTKVGNYSIKDSLKLG